MVKRAAIYLRVSTKDQTVENQRLELEALAAQRGWQIVDTFADEGISGAKGRDKRPGLDRMLKDACRGKFDVVLCWAIDRLGRSLPHLLEVMQAMHGARVDLFIHQQAIDTTTPAGKAMFAMCGVFAEFERELIRERVNAGIARAKANGVHTGRPPPPEEKIKELKYYLEQGLAIREIGRRIGVSNQTIYRVKKEMAMEKMQ